MKLDEFVFEMNIGEVSQYGVCQLNDFNIYVNIFHDDPEIHYINIYNREGEQQLMTLGTWEEVLPDIRRIIYE